MSKTPKDKELDRMYRELIENRDSRSSSGNEGNRLLTFFIGLLMLGGGLFMIFQNITVSSSWGYSGHFFSIGSFHISNGMIMFPIIVGIAMLFLMKRKIFGLTVLSIGIVIVLLSVMLTTHLSWKTTSAYVFVIMFGLTASGGAIVLRELFRKN